MEAQKNRHHFADHISQLIFFYENYYKFIILLLNFVANGLVKLSQYRLRYWFGTEQAKSLSETIMA